MKIPLKLIPREGPGEAIRAGVLEASFCSVTTHLALMSQVREAMGHQAVLKPQLLLMHKSGWKHF